MEEFISKVLSTPPATILPAEAPAPMSLIAPNAPAPTPAPIQAPILPPIAPTTSPPFPPPIPAPTPAVSPTPPPVAGAPPPMALQTVEQPGGSCQVISLNLTRSTGKLTLRELAKSHILSSVRSLMHPRNQHRVCPAANDSNPGSTNSETIMFPSKQCATQKHVFLRVVPFKFCLWFDNHRLSAMPTIRGDCLPLQAQGLPTSRVLLMSAAAHVFEPKVSLLLFYYATGIACRSVVFHSGSI